MQETWEWVDQGNQQLIFLDRFAMAGWTSLAEQGEVRIQPLAATLSELSSLLLLGHYLPRVANLRSTPT